MRLWTTVFLCSIVVLFGALILRSAAAITAGQASTVEFTGVYGHFQYTTSRCSLQHPILGKEPAPPGTYPVFIHLVGTGEAYDGTQAIQFIEEMARRGYVSASVSFSGVIGDATNYDNRSKCIYNGADPNSAVAQLCSRIKADCSKGIITSGFSLGAMLAARSNNHEPRIQAVYALSLNDKVNFDHYFALIDPANRTLPVDRLRIINGASSAYHGDAYSEREMVRRQLNIITGLNCPLTANSCLRSNGSGWYMVQDSEVLDGNADHCYFRVEPNTCGARPFDPGWLPPANGEWSLSTNLDWLAQFTSEPSPSPSASPLPSPSPSSSPLPSYSMYLPFVSGDGAGSSIRHNGTAENGTGEP